MVMDAAAELRRLADALVATPATPLPAPAAEDALAAVALLRTELDQAERRLIEQARDSGLPWRRIARALGLASRQAAEQRYLRLTRTTRADRSRQRDVDIRALRELRAAVESLRVLARSLPADGPAGLARASLDLAAEAPPGVLHDLVRAALDDLETVHLDRRQRYAAERARAAART